jgi:hypothetical protein
MDSKESIPPASLAGQYVNPIPTRFLAPVYCYKIPALCRDTKEKEFTTMCCSPSGQALCLGSYDRYAVHRRNVGRITEEKLVFI